MPVSKHSVPSSVPAPPVFIKTPPTFVEVLLGDSLTLSCGAHGNPRPTVVWHKDDSRIEKHEKIKVSWTDGTCGVWFKFFEIYISFTFVWRERPCLLPSGVSWSSFLLFFSPLILSPCPLPPGSQWFLVFNLRHKEYLRSVQMSRVQLRGEPHPLLAAAGQRSVVNSQSPHSASALLNYKMHWKFWLIVLPKA